METLRKEFDVNPVPSVIVNKPDLVPYEDHQQQINDLRAEKLGLIEGLKAKLNSGLRANQIVLEFTITSDEEQMLVSSLRLITERLGVIFVDGRP